MAIKRYFAEADNTITNAYKEDMVTRGTGSNMGQSDILEVLEKVRDKNRARRRLGGIIAIGGGAALVVTGNQLLNRSCAGSYCFGDLYYEVYGGAFVAVGSMMTIAGGVSLLPTWDRKFNARINRLKQSGSVTEAESFLQGQAKKYRRRRMLTGSASVAVGLLAFAERALEPGIFYTCLGLAVFSSPRPMEVAWQEYNEDKKSAQQAKQSTIQLQAPSVSVGPNRSPYIRLSGTF